jgi:hypothetical protein
LAVRVVRVAPAFACVAVRLALLRALVPVALAPVFADAPVRLAAVDVFFAVDDGRFAAGMFWLLIVFTVGRAYPK